MPPRWNGAGTGDTALVEQLLDLGVAMGAVDIAGYTPVAWAAAGGHAPCVSLLLEAGSGVGVADNEGRLPLHWAAERGFAQVVALLVPAMLQSGLDLNALVSSSLAPLPAAMQSQGFDPRGNVKQLRDPVSLDISDPVQRKHRACGRALSNRAWNLHGSVWPKGGAPEGGSPILFSSRTMTARQLLRWRLPKAMWNAWLRSSTAPQLRPRGASPPCILLFRWAAISSCLDTCEDNQRMLILPVKVCMALDTLHMQLLLLPAGWLGAAGIPAAAVARRCA